MTYFVSRQMPWGIDLEEDEQYVVEVNVGGIEYSNPDMLVAKYAGEAEEYEDPREAIAAAFEIAEAWQKDWPGIVVSVGAGNTHGMTMPFEPEERAALEAWAEAEWASLPKCDCGCGQLLPEHPYFFIDDDQGERFATEYCAEKAYWFYQQCQAEFDAEFEKEEAEE